MERNEEYIIALEQKNRIKKMASSKSLKERHDDGRERGKET